MTGEILQALMNGLLIGGVYAVISVGLALVFGVMHIVNFAQGEFMMLGMYVAYVVFEALGIDPIAGALIAFGVVFVLGWLIQRLLIERVIEAPMLSQIFLTVAIGLFLVGAIELIFGADFQSVATPYQTAAVNIGSLVLPGPYLVAFSVSLVITAALYLLLEKTDFGRAMRAVAQNRMAAQLVGLNPKRIFALAFATGTGLAALGGAIILPYAFAYPTVGHQYALIMFTVVVLAGLGSVHGAIIGGFVIGIVHSLSAVLMPMELQNLSLFIVFLGTLMIRPTGLFGR